MSICPHCKGFSWEIHEESPRGGAFKLNFVRCVNCKAPVGVLPYYDIHSKLEKMDTRVTTLGDSLTSLLQTIDSNIRRLFLK